MKYKYLATFVAFLPFLPYITISASQDVEHTNFAKRQSIMAEEHQLRLSLNTEQNSDRTKLRATFFVYRGLVQTIDDSENTRFSVNTEMDAEYRVIQDEFNSVKQQISERVHAIPVKKIRLADGTILEVRESVVGQIPFLERQFSGNWVEQPDADGALVLVNEENLNPMLLRRIINYQTEKDSGVQLESPTKLFESVALRDPYGGIRSETLNSTWGYDNSFMAINAQMFALLDYLGLDALSLFEKEIHRDDIPKGYVIKSVDELRSLAILPDTIIAGLDLKINIQSPTLIYGEDFDTLIFRLLSSKAKMQFGMALLTK